MRKPYANNAKLFAVLANDFVVSHYFLAFARLALNFSTLPAVSINFFLPVKKGWQLLQISTSIFSLAEPAIILFPQAHLIIALEKY